MKRAILFGLMLMCTSVMIASGVTARASDKNLFFGVKVGTTFSDLDIGLSTGGLDIHRDVDTDTRAGFCGGLFASLALSRWFAVQPEVLYSMKGQRNKEAEGNPGIKLHYVEVPLLAKLTIPTETIVTPNLFFGPSMAFKVDARLKGSDLSVDIGDYVKTMDIGLVFGGGLDFALRTLKLTLDARYTLGLRDIGDLPGELYASLPKGTDIDFKNRTISLMVGLGF